MKKLALAVVFAATTAFANAPAADAKKPATTPAPAAEAKAPEAQPAKAETKPAETKKDAPKTAAETK